MVKHTQTICRQFGDKLFEFVGPFCGVGAVELALKGALSGLRQFLAAESTLK